MKLLQFDKRHGDYDIYRYFEEIGSKPIKYINLIKNPERAAFNFITTQTLAGLVKDEDIVENKNYLIYTVQTESESELMKLFEGFEDLFLNRAGLSDFSCIYYIEETALKIVTNICSMSGELFENVEYRLKTSIEAYT